MSVPTAARPGPDHFRRSGLAAGVLLLAAGCSSSDGGAAGPSVRVDVAGAVVTVETATTRIEVVRDPFAIRFLGGGSLRTETAPEGALSWERGGAVESVVRVSDATALPDGAELSVATTGGGAARLAVRFPSERTARLELAPDEPESLAALGAAFASPPGERIYGLTERLRDSPPIAEEAGIEIPVEDVRPPEAGGLDRRGERVEMLVRPTQALYAPFFQSSRGFGLEVGGTAIGWFDLAAADPAVVSLRFETGASAASRRLVLHLIDGPGHPRILEEYAALHGAPFVPPDWAFRHWKWRGELTRGPVAALDGAELNADVVDDLTMYEALGFPAGVYLFDRPVLAGEYGFARFEWDEERLPSPRAMLDALRRRGWRVLLWSSLFMCGDEPSDFGAEAFRLGFLAPGPALPPRCGDVGGQNFILDPTNPAAASWFQDRLASFVAANDIDGIKLDRGEEHIPTAATDVWADGRNGREVRNDYPSIQARLHHEVMSRHRPDGDFLVAVRAGYTGTPAHAIAWGGDTAGSESFGAGPGTDLGLRAAIIQQQRAAFLGYPVWGSDTGGYYAFEDRDLFARWIEFSAFSGLMEIGGVGSHEPWAMPTEPAFDEEMIAIYRRYTTLREELVPYLAAAAEEARTRGLPLVRPLVFEWPEDPEVGDLWDEYMLGPDLLVAPVWRLGERARSVYLPEGRWTDVRFPERRFDGPARIDVEAPLDHIPVYRRAGSGAAASSG
jgi:alpha-glucosidase (family GH31 glycosyl hydrolase)